MTVSTQKKCKISHYKHVMQVWKALTYSKECSPYQCKRRTNIHCKTTLSDYKTQFTANDGQMNELSLTCPLDGRGTGCIFGRGLTIAQIQLKLEQRAARTRTRQTKNRSVNEKCAFLCEIGHKTYTSIRIFLVFPWYQF